MATTKIPHDAQFKKQKLSKTGGRRKLFEQDKRLEEGITSGKRRNDLLPGCTVELRPLSSLNVRVQKIRDVCPEQLERVAHSMATLGFVGAIIVRGDTIIDGVIRFEAAKRLGLDRIPCLPVDHLTEPEARQAALALNRIGELGAWRLDELKIELEELISLELDLTATGFTPEEIDIITLDDPPGLEDEEDEIPLPPVEPVSRLGDFYTLGDHRLGCADSLDRASYENLMRGAVATATLTDPPFNVKIANNVSGLGKTKHGEFVMASGEMSRPQFEAFLHTFLSHSAEFTMDGGVLFAFMDWRSLHLLVFAAENVGLTQVNLAVWDKGAGGMGAFYRSAHELVPVFCKGERLAINNVALGKHGRDRSNVWRYPGANRRGTAAALALADHPTPKNVHLISDAILDVTRRGDIVLDPFLGSGTAIIAAETTGRACYGLELSPGFVDVCVRRWEQQTGRDAIHEASGLTFSQLARVREEARGRDDSGSDASI